MSEGVSEVSSASERVSGTSERANGRASGPVLTSLFLFVPDHSATAEHDHSYPRFSISSHRLSLHLLHGSAGEDGGHGMDLEGLKVVVGGDLEDGFGTPWVPEADVAVDGRRDDLAVDAPLSVHVHHPTLVLAQRHHSVGKGGKITQNHLIEESLT